MKRQVDEDRIYREKYTNIERRGGSSGVSEGGEKEGRKMEKGDRLTKNGLADQ